MLAGWSETRLRDPVAFKLLGRGPVQHAHMPALLDPRLKTLSHGPDLPPATLVPVDPTLDVRDYPKAGLNVLNVRDGLVSLLGTSHTGTWPRGLAVGRSVGCYYPVQL